MTNFTDIETVDNLINLGLGFLLGILIVGAGWRFLKMFIKHEYAQLMVALMVFAIVFIFIAKPSVVMDFFEKNSTDIQKQIIDGTPGNGSGGPAQ